MRRRHRSQGQSNLLRMSVVLVAALATTAVSALSPVAAATRQGPPQWLFDEWRQWNGTYSVVIQQTTTVTNPSTPVSPTVQTINAQWRVEDYFSVTTRICDALHPESACYYVGVILDPNAGTGSVHIVHNTPGRGSGACDGVIQFKRDRSGNKSLVGHCTAEPLAEGRPGLGDRERDYMEFTGKDVAARGISPLKFKVPVQIAVKAGVKYTRLEPAYSFCTPAVAGADRCGMPGTTNPTGGTPSATDPNYFTYAFFVQVGHGRLPLGLSLDRNTGAITGTVKKSARKGPYPVTVCAKSVGLYVVGQETDVCHKTKLELR